jgi:hypothetical protein
MKLVSALVGLAALGGIALTSVTASAMPVAIPGHTALAPSVEQAAYVCNAWGHCWDRPAYSDGYTHPHYWGGWGWHRGWGGYGWHHWHPHYWGGWGSHHPWGGYGWHHWHQW